jgi:hypothetical protein
VSYGFPAVKVEAALADGPGTLPGDATWTDLTDRTLGWDVRRGRGSQFDQPQPGQATVRFSNTDGLLSPAASWDSLVRADDPVGWWKFTEASGPFLDSSGNGYTLTASGTPGYLEPGIIDDGVATDVANYGGNRTYTAALNPAQITIETWVRPDSLVADGGLWSSQNGSVGYLAYMRTDGVIHAGAYANYNVASAGTAVVGEWMHIAWTNDGNIGKLYINGVLVDTASQVMTVNPSTNFYFGSDGGANKVTATYDELAVYNYVLSEGRIRAHASGIAIPVGAQVRITTSHYRARVHADSPVGFWLLDETSGTTARDDSGNARNGTHTGPTVNQTSLVALESGSDGQQSYPRRSVLYDGSNDYTEVAHHADWVPDSGGWTLQLLANFTAVGASTARNLISKSDSTTTDWLFQVDASNQLLFRYVDVGGTNRDTTTAWTPTVSTTYHLAATWDGTYVRLYIDGTLATTSADLSANVPRSGSGRPLRFARHQNAYVFNGRLDEIAVHQTCLPDQTIADLAQMATTGTRLFHGYAEQWPNRWEQQTVGMSTVVAYDALAQLNRKNLPLADWRNWTMAYRPDAYWRLDDPEGTTAAADETGHYRAHVAHDANGVTDDGIVWEFEPPAVGEGTGAVFVGSLLEPPRAALASGTDEFTIETWAAFVSGTSTTRYLLVAEDASASNVDVILAVTTTVDAESMTVDATTTGTVASGNYVRWIGSPSTAGVGGWVHIVFSRYIEGTDETLILRVNGTTLLPSWPDYAVATLDSTRLFIGADQNLVGNNLAGDILDEFAIYPYCVEPPTLGARRTGQTVRWSQHRTDWGKTRWQNDTASERIGRILDLARWPLDFDTFAGTAPFVASAGDRVPLSPPNSGTALAHCQDAATTNGSIFYVDGDGQFVLTDPATAARYTFADDGTALSYSDIVIANDDQLVYTAAEVRDGTGKEFVAVDDIAADLYGGNRWTGDLLTVSPNVAQAFADWQVYRYSMPAVRISSIAMVNPTKPAAAVCMGFHPGERVQVQRTDGDFALDVGVYVDEIVWSMDAASRKLDCRLQLSPAEVDDDTFRLDVSLLDGGDILAYA